MPNSTQHWQYWSLKKCGRVVLKMRSVLVGYCCYRRRRAVVTEILLDFSSAYIGHIPVPPRNFHSVSLHAQCKGGVPDISNWWEANDPEDWLIKKAKLVVMLDQGFLNQLTLSNKPRMLIILRLTRLIPKSCTRFQESCDFATRLSMAELNIIRLYRIAHSEMGSTSIPFCSKPWCWLSNIKWTMVLQFSMLRC